jgi:putative transposase
MKVIFYDVCNDFEAELIEMDGEGDHVHLLINYPPKVSVSKLVNSLKEVSNRLIRKKHPSICKNYGGTRYDRLVISPEVVVVCQ